MSTRTSTTLLRIQPDAHIVPLTATLSTSPTLAIGPIVDASFLHVSPSAVTLRSSDGGMATKSTWQTGEEEEIVAASISGDLAIVAKRGGDVSILQRTSDEVQELW